LAKNTYIGRSLNDLCIIVGNSWWRTGLLWGLWRPFR